MREYFVRRSDGCEDPNLHMGRKAFITALLLWVTAPAGNRTRILTIHASSLPKGAHFGDKKRGVSLESRRIKKNGLGFTLTYKV
ncbi:hypothetical protein RJ640_003788 [Escallonia rubra]|uniref:Uncharacterized protein n=1 Tax=Escallonia rubra TaxID=112253 RepID=A0AA88UMD0_9ASTE|nr:hypothetical protein RJ640_003788 [Escallonia rubra]